MRGIEKTCLAHPEVGQLSREKALVQLFQMPAPLAAFFVEHRFYLKTQLTDILQLLRHVLTDIFQKLMK